MTTLAADTQPRRDIDASGVRRGAAWDCSGKDVTALRERTSRSRHGDALTRVLRDGLCEVDADGRIVEVNARFCEMVGFSAAELLGTRAAFAFWPEEDHDTLAAQFGLSLTSDERRVELVFCRKDGERFPVTLDASHIEVGANMGAFIRVVRDMSREVAERERLREAHRVARLASWELDPTTMLLEFSSDLRHIGGPRLPRDEREHFEPRLSEVRAMLPARDGEHVVEQASETVADGQTRRLEHRYLRAGELGGDACRAPARRGRARHDAGHHRAQGGPARDRPAGAAARRRRGGADRDRPPGPRHALEPRCGAALRLVGRRSPRALDHRVRGCARGRWGRRRRLPDLHQLSRRGPARMGPGGARRPRHARHHPPPSARRHAVRLG